MVAAWMSAETGVGPSMASGSHTCRGNCADLPTAPAKMPSAKSVSTASVIWPCWAISWMSGMLKVLVFDQMSRTASRKPISPRRVVRNAFFAASAADFLWNQKPMSRYEPRPTSSQKTYTMRMLSIMMRPSMAAVNSDM